MKCSLYLLFCTSLVYEGAFHFVRELYVCGSPLGGVLPAMVLNANFSEEAQVPETQNQQMHVGPMFRLENPFLSLFPQLGGVHDHERWYTDLIHTALNPIRAWLFFQLPWVELNSAHSVHFIF